MLKYTPFYSRLWSDKKFRNLSVKSKLFFIYLFTNENITLSGIYELDLEICSIRLKLNGEIEAMLKEVIDLKMVEWDSENEIIWVISRFKLLPTRSPKVIFGVVNELEQLTHPFKEKFIIKYRDIISPYLYKIKPEEFDTEDYLKRNQLNHLVKIYDSKISLKKFLMNRGCSEFRIDQVIKDILPNLKNG